MVTNQILRSAQDDSIRYAFPSGEISREVFPKGTAFIAPRVNTLKGRGRMARTYLYLFTP